MDGEQFTYLKLRVNEQIILIALNEIHLVLPIAAFQTMPQCDLSIAGILNYHGKSITIYHLSELIHSPRPEYDVNTPILLCTIKQKLIGFLVSDISEIINLKENQIQEPPPTWSFIAGIIENESWSGWVLNVENLIQHHVQGLEHCDA